MSKKTMIAWSGGKDSALALNEILKTCGFEIVRLLTTVERDYNRISIHGVNTVLLEHQAISLGFPLEKIFLSEGASDAEYENELLKALKKQRDKGIYFLAFGDIFLEDIKKYREQILAKANIKGLYPLWHRNTQELARKFIKLGFKAIITSIDSNVLGKDFVGREYDEQFLSDLPKDVDPCGENGEFHSFVYGGPIFRQKIPFKKGEVMLRKSRFYSYDLQPI